MNAPLVLLPLSMTVGQDVCVPARHTACGITWDADDVVRFLSKCVWQNRTTTDYVRTDFGDGSFYEKVTTNVGRCLIFTGARSRGQGNKQWYGSFRVKSKTVRAHKFYAVAVLGLRPGPGDELDHGCYNTRCVSCLECVPRAVNQARIRRRERDAEGGLRQITADREDAARDQSAPALTQPSVPPGHQPG